MSPNLTGAMLMIASMVAFTINDTFVKLTDGAVPLSQLLFLRGLMTTVLMLVLAHFLGLLRFNFARRDWHLVIIRAVAEVFAAYFFLSALFNMPIGNLTAVLQALPLTLTLGSALFFGEAVGWRRWSAIAIGFVGVLLIVRPGADGFNIWSIFALLAVAAVTVRDLSTRRLSGDVPGMSVSIVTAGMLTVVAGLAATAQPWAPVSFQNMMLIVASSVSVLAGYYFSVQVMRVGDVSFVAPFRYTGLIAAMIAGFFVFREVPSVLTLIGAGIVMATGLFTFYRERQALRTRIAPQ